MTLDNCRECGKQRDSAYQCPFCSELFCSDKCKMQHYRKMKDANDVTHELSEDTRYAAIVVLSQAGWCNQRIAKAITRKIEYVERALKRNAWRREPTLPGDLDHLWLSVRAVNAIKRIGAVSISDMKTKFDQLSAIRGVGTKTIEEIRQLLQQPESYRFDDDSR
jgi:Bacterial RNA polymerase, alpha chain C terminal domain